MGTACCPGPGALRVSQVYIFQMCQTVHLKYVLYVGYTSGGPFKVRSTQRNAQGVKCGIT